MNGSSYWTSAHMDVVVCLGLSYFQNTLVKSFCGIRVLPTSIVLL